MPATIHLPEATARGAVQGTLYHVPPADFRGDAVLPLEQLRSRYPDLYERHARKYASRPDAPARRIEPLFSRARGRR